MLLRGSMSPSTLAFVIRSPLACKSWTKKGMIHQETYTRSTAIDYQVPLHPFKGMVIDNHVIPLSC